MVVNACHIVNVISVIVISHYPKTNNISLAITTEICKFKFPDVCTIHVSPVIVIEVLSCTVVNIHVYRLFLIVYGIFIYCINIIITITVYINGVCPLVFRIEELCQEGQYKGAPLRTQAGGRWLNGFSDHLPVVMYLVKEVK